MYVLCTYDKFLRTVDSGWNWNLDFVLTSSTNDTMPMKVTDIGLQFRCP